LAHPELGGSDRYLKRGAEGVSYVDGVRAPVTEPNVRTVSNELFRGDDTVLTPHGHNLLWTFFGQFITHDMLGVHRKGDLNASEIPDSNNTDVWIRVDMHDPTDPLFPLLRPEIPFIRIIRSRGDVVNGVFEIGSDSTAFLDLDVVYGKNVNVSELLRSHTDGLLKYRVYSNYTAYPGSASTVPVTQKGDFGEWLPLFVDVDPARTTVPLSNQLVLQTTLNINNRALATGDGRNAENYALQVIQGLFLREHNRIARQLKQAHPDWSDELLFQKARRLNIAQYQSIVMYEWLPSLLLNDYSRVGRYRGYDNDIDPTASHLFAFALRFGHTTVPNAYTLRNRCNIPPFNSTRDGPRSGQSFGGQMGADQIAQVGIPENILHANLFIAGGKVDVQFPESLRTLRGAVSDVIAQNQMRANEHGLPGYNDIRKLWHGAPHPNIYDYPLCDADENSPAPDPINCFLYINSNTTVASSLRSLYGKVNLINFYTAVVAEEPRRASIGQTSARIVADQFRRSRDGDRWWFEGAEAGFTNQEVRDMRRDLTMSTLLQRNFPNANVQPDAFYIPEVEFFTNCV
jgi:peroxidase